MRGPPAGPGTGVVSLEEENRRLRERLEAANGYIREKTNQLLRVVGTVPLRPDELDDAHLVELDPIGIVADSFVQVLAHLHAANAGLDAARREVAAVFDSVGVGVMVVDRDRRILSCNRKLREQFLGDGGELLGHSCRDAVCGSRGPAGGCTVDRVLEATGPVGIPGWAHGGRVYDIVGTPILDADGKVAKVVVAFGDVTERMEAEGALRASEERYRDLFENATDLIQSVRPDGTFAYANRAWREALGYAPEDLEGLTVFDVVHPDSMAHCQREFQRVMAGETLRDVQVVFRTKGGEALHVEGSVSCQVVDGLPAATRGLFRDVTERRRLEEELRRAQKLESVGQLAGGIAHDFNNLLTGILANLSLVLRRPGDPADRRRLQDAEKATLRARDLTQQLLTFSRGGAPVFGAFLLPPLLEEVAALALAGSAARCETRFEPDLPPIHGDEGQIGQVLHNLLVNASQAMPHGGVVEVRGATLPEDEREGLSLPAGRYVRLTVEDHGIGIPPEDLGRVFDPYFTTKQGGTGLGLAVSYSVVKKHGGHIAAESRPGRGTTLRVILPAAGAVSSRPEAPEPHDCPPRQGRVLVLDDEPLLRDVVTDMLSELGYEARAVADGAEALELYAQEAARGLPFDAVIMDLTIPGGMGGREALEHLRRLDPEVRAIVSSGYSADPVLSSFRDYGFRDVVAKPYTLSRLAQVLERVLAGR